MWDFVTYFKNIFTTLAKKIFCLSPGAFCPGGDGVYDGGGHEGEGGAGHGAHQRDEQVQLRDK